MDFQSNTSSQYAGALSASTPQRQIPGHAQALYTLASDLSKANHRLHTLLDRLNGPRPESPSQQKDMPEPSGALLVAAFGVERIRQQISELEGLIARLEELA